MWERRCKGVGGKVYGCGREGVRVWEGRCKGVGGKV